MGLKQDLIDAKVKSIKAADEKIWNQHRYISDGSFIEREAEYQKKLLLNF